MSRHLCTQRFLRNATRRLRLGNTVARSLLALGSALDERADGSGRCVALGHFCSELLALFVRRDCLLSQLALEGLATILQLRTLGLQLGDVCRQLIQVDLLLGEQLVHALQLLIAPGHLRETLEDLRLGGRGRLVELLIASRVALQQREILGVRGELRHLVVVLSDLLFVVPDADAKCGDVVRRDCHGTPRLGGEQIRIGLAQLSSSILVLLALFQELTQFRTPFVQSVTQLLQLVDLGDVLSQVVQCGRGSLIVHSETAQGCSASV